MLYLKTFIHQFQEYKATVYKYVSELIKRVRGYDLLIVHTGIVLVIFIATSDFNMNTIRDRTSCVMAL